MEWILPAIALSLLTWGIWIFNRLVRHKHLVREAWSGIDVQLKRRHDLIPALIETVRAYGRYEEDLLTRITTARNVARESDAVARAGVESDISHGLLKLFAVAEAYPELKASTHYLDLQRNLTEVEEAIQYARRYYNGTVRELNVLIEAFPSNLVASLFGFRQAVYFEVELATRRQSPDIDRS